MPNRDETIDCPFCCIGEIIRDHQDHILNIAHCTHCLEEITIGDYNRLMRNMKEVVLG